MRLEQGARLSDYYPLSPDSRAEYEAWRDRAAPSRRDVTIDILPADGVAGALGSAGYGTSPPVVRRPSRSRPHGLVDS